MARLDFTCRAAPERITLPARYDDLTPEQRREVRDEYMRLQDGLCYHCKNHLNDEPSMAMRALPLNMRLFPPGFLRWPHHLHHDHKTGLTIGTVHARCNGILFQYHGE